MKKYLSIFLALAMLCTLLPAGFAFASGQPGWTYFASSSEAEGTPSELGPGLAFDGDEETRWSSVFKDAAGSFIGVDFGKSFTFNSVIINECKNWGHVTGFKLQKWENNSWVDFYSGNGINDKRRIMFNPVTTTKMRVYFESVDCADENFATVTIFEIDVEMSDSDETQLLGDGGYFEMPLLTNSPTVKGNFLYLVGGYNSNDAGCPIWGTVKNNESLYIGDSAGTLSIVYQSGKKQEVPLIFGYNMWFHNYWSDPNFGSPFKGRYVEPEYQDLLKQTLHLEGAFEASESPIMKVKLLPEPVKSIDIIDNAEKPGYAVFKTGYITEGNLTAVASDASFFETHLIDGANPYPQAMQENIKKIQKRLMTFEEDFENAPDFSYPDGYTGTKIDFSGTPLAETASGVVYYNLENLKNRTDSDGMIHTSAKDAPCWHYDGFGPWIDNFGCFYDSFYSRDGARAIMSLANLGATDKAQSGMNYSNKWMMYYPENSLTINGKAIPGHWSVILNKPLEYSKNLTKVGWATQYTQEKFGADYENLGNQETDGHGMMMLANYNVWTRGGQSAQWVNDNWKYINEAASWILWCYENTNESFAKDGLLYAESEGGMMQWTMYCNLPCYLGMKAYAQMAQKAGKTAEAASWNACADKMYAAINKKFAEGDAWSLARENTGFFHDSMPLFYSDFVGLDLLQNMPQEWYERSQNTFDADMAKDPVNGTYFGPKGVSYDHGTITQNALLLDRTADAGKFLENLTKISYSPRLPQPYIVPECFSVDTEQGIYRRQGDLGNLVQLSEALKCYYVAAGVDAVRDGVLTIMPRLPEKWNLDFDNQDVTLAYKLPANNKQTITVTPKGTASTVKLRVGPFDTNVKSVLATVNGQEQQLQAFTAGDSNWAWVTIDNAAAQTTYTITATASTSSTSSGNGSSGNGSSGNGSSGNGSSGNGSSGNGSSGNGSSGNGSSGNEISGNEPSGQPETPAAVSAPQVQVAQTEISVLNLNAVCEYSLDQINWNLTGKFNNLEPGTYYTVYCRKVGSIGGAGQSASTLVRTLSEDGAPGAAGLFAATDVENKLETPQNVTDKTYGQVGERTIGGTKTAVYQVSAMDETQAAALDGKLDVTAGAAGDGYQLEMSAATANALAKNNVIIKAGTTAAYVELDAAQLMVAKAAKLLGADESAITVVLRIWPATNKTYSAPYGIEILYTDNTKQTKTAALDGYMTATIKIPGGTAVSTAVLLDENGTASHVPTQIVNGFALCAVKQLGVLALSQNAASFADMDGHWAKADVENLAGRLVVNGYEDGSFKPDNGVTRSEFAAMTVRALGLVKLPSQGFADVQPGAWYDAFVGGAKAYGIIAGYEDGSFRPGDPITRQEAMVMIQRAAKLCGMEQGEGGSLEAYADGGEVAAWAQNAVLFCTQNGIIQGSGGLLSPQKQISRGETAAILLRLLQKAGLV